MAEYKETKIKSYGKKPIAIRTEEIVTRYGINFGKDSFSEIKKKICNFENQI